MRRIATGVPAGDTRFLFTVNVPLYIRRLVAKRGTLSAPSRVVDELEPG